MLLLRVTVIVIVRRLAHVVRLWLVEPGLDVNNPVMLAA